jgi:hypothetical protein
VKHDDLGHASELEHAALVEDVQLDEDEHAGAPQCPRRSMPCVTLPWDTSHDAASHQRCDAEREHDDGDRNLAHATGAEDRRVGRDVVAAVGDSDASNADHTR